MIPFENDDLPHVHRIGKYAEGLWDLCTWASTNTRGERAVEVGSYLGESAQIISRFYKELWCVDPWGINYQNTPAMDVFLKRFPGANTPQGCTTSWGSRVYMLQMESPRASYQIKGTFDFVYIDGNHGYAPCKADIEAWRPKVSQGVFSGHDYDPVLQPGVVKAVDEVLGKPENVFVDTSWAFVMGK